MDLDEERKMFKRLTKIHDSTNKAVEQLQSENKRLQASLQMLLYEKKQWDQSKVNQNDIIQRTLDLNNAQMQQLHQEIDQLRKENTKLREELSGGW